MMRLTDEYQRHEQCQPLNQRRLCSDLSVCRCIHRRDFFLGSNFHTMPNEELSLSGFHLDNSSSVGESGWRHGLPNALAAYRTPHENAK